MAKDDLTLPVDIRTTIGISLVRLCILLSLAILLALGPLLSARSVSESLHSVSLYILAGVSLLTLWSCFFGRMTFALKIDQSGVDFSIRKKRYYIVWSDIAHVSTIQQTTRIELKGRPDDEAVTIPAALNLKAEKLTALLREGLERWGATSAGGKFGHAWSELPTGAGKAQTRANLVRAMWLVGGAFGVIAVVGIVGLFTEYHKAMELRTHGVRMEGVIERTQTGDCGAHSCRNVEYTYQITDGELRHGILYFTRDDNLNDPDYLFVMSHTTIPIVVDMNHPNVSDVNFDDRVFTSDPLKLMVFKLAVNLPTLFGLGGFWILYLYWCYRKAAQSN